MFLPGASGLIGGKYDFNVYGENKFNLKSNTDTQAIIFNGVTSTLGAGLDNGTNKFINDLQKSGLESTIRIVTNTGISLLEQEVNKINGNSN